MARGRQTPPTAMGTDPKRLKPSVKRLGICSGSVVIACGNFERRFSWLCGGQAKSSARPCWNRTYQRVSCACSSGHFSALGADHQNQIGGYIGGRKIRKSAKLLFLFNKIRGSGGPRRIRTPDPLIRSQVLYPAELSVREGGD